MNATNLALGRLFLRKFFYPTIGQNHPFGVDLLYQSRQRLGAIQLELKSDEQQLARLDDLLKESSRLGEQCARLYTSLAKSWIEMTRLPTSFTTIMAKKIGECEPVPQSHQLFILAIERLLCEVPLQVLFSEAKEHPVLLAFIDDNYVVQILNEVLHTRAIVFLHEYGHDLDQIQFVLVRCQVHLPSFLPKFLSLLTGYMFVNCDDRPDYLFASLTTNRSFIYTHLLTHCEFWQPFRQVVRDYLYRMDEENRLDIIVRLLSHDTIKLFMDKSPSLRMDLVDIIPRILRQVVDTDQFLTLYRIHALYCPLSRTMRQFCPQLKHHMSRLQPSDFIRLMKFMTHTLPPDTIENYGHFDVIARDFIVDHDQHLTLRDTTTLLSHLRHAKLIVSMKDPPPNLSRLLNSYLTEADAGGDECRHCEKPLLACLVNMNELFQHVGTFGLRFMRVWAYQCALLIQTVIFPGQEKARVIQEEIWDDDDYVIENESGG